MYVFPSKRKHVFVFYFTPPKMCVVFSIDSFWKDLFLFVSAYFHLGRTALRKRNSICDSLAGFNLEAVVSRIYLMSGLNMSGIAAKTASSGSVKQRFIARLAYASATWNSF